MNATRKYSLTTRLIHWLSALMIFFMFTSGWYMVDLDYYSAWYVTLPQLHFSIGVAVIIVWTTKIIRLLFKIQPKLPPPLRLYERLLATLSQFVFYFSIIILMTTGYLMMTAEGHPKVLFNTLKLPALTQFSGAVVDTMGWLHEYSAYILMFFAALHIIGAFKHHFIDKDDTLKRII